MPNIDWKSKTVLITGATGFFGSWLVRSFLNRGANVVAIVRSHKPESQFFLEGFDQRVKVEKGSVYDAPFIREVFARNRPDFFFHAAYGADVNRVLQEPLECFRSSVESTWVALDTIRQSDFRCVTVICSSDKAYGSQQLPYLESNPLTPRHPYEVAKASLDLAAQSFGKIYRMPIGVTRCGNFFGPYDFNFTRLLPGVMKSLVHGEPPVLRSDGRFTRDFLYVEDATEAHILLAEQLSQNDALYGEAFNFSYGEQMEIIDLVRLLVDISGVDVEPQVVDGAQAEIRHMHLSSDKAKDLLGWEPKFQLTEGLRRTVAWYQWYFSQDERVRSAAMTTSS